MIDPVLTVIDAASFARTDAENVRAALASGDLRNLRRSTVTAWSRARVAETVTRATRP